MSSGLYFTVLCITLIVFICGYSNSKVKLRRLHGEDTLFENLFTVHKVEPIPHLITLSTFIENEFNISCIHHSFKSCLYSIPEELPVYLVDSLMDINFEEIRVNLVSGQWNTLKYGNTHSPSQLSSSFKLIFANISTNELEMVHSEYIKVYRHIKSVFGTALRLGIGLERMTSKVHISTQNQKYILSQALTSLSTLCTDNIYAWKQLLPYQSLRTFKNLFADDLIIDWFTFSPWKSLSVKISKKKTASFSRDFRDNNSILASIRQNVGFRMEFEIQGIVIPVPKDFQSKLYSESVSNLILSQIQSIISNEDVNEVDTNGFRSDRVDSSKLMVQSSVIDSRRDRFAKVITIANTLSIPVLMEMTEYLPIHYQILLHSYSYSYVYSIITLENQIGTNYSCHDNSHRHFISDLNSFQLIERKNPLELLGSISYVIEIKPNESLRIEYTALKHFLHRKSFPPDSSRGLDVLPSDITISSSDYRDREARKVIGSYTTEMATILMPFPDFTMPFNVITLVGNYFVFDFICCTHLKFP